MAKIGRPIKFVIRLTPEERTRLDGMIHCGKGSVNSALKARILLKADVSQSGPGWSDERIAEALETSALATVHLATGRCLHLATGADSSGDGRGFIAANQFLVSHRLGPLMERQRSKTDQRWPVGETSDSRIAHCERCGCWNSVCVERWGLLRRRSYEPIRIAVGGLKENGDRHRKSSTDDR